MNPLSPIYYIRNNKSRAALIIFMLFFTTLLFIAGNYVASCDWYMEKSIEHSERIALVEYIPADEDWSDYYATLGDIQADPRLHVMERSGRGFGGLGWSSTIGIDLESASYVFNSREDMEAAVKRLGLTVDLSDVKDHSIVISEALARNKGIRLGDTVDGSVDESLQSAFTVDALIKDDTYTTFFLVPDEDNLARFYVLSDEMEGDALYNYLAEKIGDRRVKLSGRMKDEISNSLAPLHIVMIAGAVLLSVILAITVNSVVNGQYIKRTYEFGVYRALGLSRKTIFRKCAAELLLMDLMAIALGAAVHFLLTFLLNELLYIPKGRYIPYISGLGLICAAVSNLTVIIPMIIAKGHRMGRADVTEF